MDIQSIIKNRFDQVWDMIKSAGFSADVHPEESKIRLEQAITDGKSQYIFNIKQTDVDGVVEHSLDRNDVFVPNRLGVFVAIKNNTTGVERLYSYIPENDGVNPSVHAAGFTTGAANTIYSGYMQWLVDNVVMLSSYPMEKFHKIPRQQGAFVLDSQDAAVNEGIQSEWAIDKAMELLIPRYTIAGTRDHKITLNFPAANLQFPVTSGYTAKLVLMLDGFLVKGGCEYKGGTGTNPFGAAVGQW